MPNRQFSAALIVTIVGIAGESRGQPNNQGFVRGHIFFGEVELEACPHPKDEPRYIREIDPVTGESWRIMDRWNGLCYPSGLIFTLNGGALRVIDSGADRVFEIDSKGSVGIAYDSGQGLSGPVGSTYDGWGNFYVSNFFLANVLRFPNDEPPPEIVVDAMDGVRGAPDLATAPSGSVFFSDSHCCIRRIAANSTSTLFDDYGTQLNVASIAFNQAGDLFASVYSALEVHLYRYDGGVAENRRLVAALPFGPGSISVDPSNGSILWLHRLAIERIDPETGDFETVFEFPQGPEYTYGAGKAIVFWPNEAGDLNCDGSVNQFDIDPFILALVDAEDYRTTWPDCQLSRADLDANGTINQFDIQPFVDALTP